MFALVPLVLNRYTVAIFVLASIVGAVYVKGVNDERGRWQGMAVENNLKAAAALAEATAKTHETERMMTDKMQKLSYDYLNSLGDLEREKADLTTRLRNNGLHINPSAKNNTNTMPNTGTDTTGAVSTTKGGLSFEDGKFLINYAVDAQTTSNQLELCKQILVSEREILH